MTDEIKKIRTPAEKAIRRAAKEQKKAEKKKQVIAFAQDVLGSTKPQAKILRKVAGKFLTLAKDGLAFKGQGGKNVAIDDPQCKEFFQREYPFLVATTLEAGALDPADVALAKSGNMTAKGRVLLALNGDEAALKVALAGKDQVVNANGNDKPLDKSKNPFIGLRDRSGKIVPEKMRAVESLLRGVGAKKAADIARSAGLRLDGTEIPERYR